MELVFDVFTTTWRMPSVSACSSLYQALIVSPWPAIEGEEARKTALSLKIVLDCGWWLRSG